MLSIIFIISAIAIFVYTFAKFIKQNNSYVYLLIMEFAGIIIDFIALVTEKELNGIILALLYLMSIVIPITIFLLEKKNIYIDEAINIAKLEKNPTNAKQILLENIEKYPNSYKSHKLLAEYYVKNNESEKAEDEYLKVINIKPDDYASYCKLGTILHDNQKDRDAKNILRELLRIKPDYVDGSKILGNILYDNGEFKNAILVFNEALKYSPAEFDLYYYIGMTYTRLNDFQNARDYYTKSAKINSYQDVANLNLGQIYLIFGEYDEAEKYFFEEINSEDEIVQANAYLYLSKIKLIKGDVNHAIAYANLAVEIYPQIITKIENDNTLSVIIGKIKLAQRKEVNTKLTKKEQEIIEHLGKTYNVVENLTDNASSHSYEKELEQ